MDFMKVLLARKCGQCSDFFETLFSKATAGSKLPDGYKKVRSLTMDNDCVPGYYDTVSETFYEPNGTNPTYTE